MPLVSRHHVRFARLRFPFAVHVQALHGTASLRDANARREVRPGDPFVVHAFAHFDCDLPGTWQQPCAIVLTAVPDSDCPRLAGKPADRPWSRQFAGLVFSRPDTDWNAERLAAQWQVPARLVRARLFAEGEALHPLLREQRAAHALHALASAGGLVPALDQLAAHAGLRSASALARAWHDWFGIDAMRLLEDCRAGGRTLAPTATWPGLVRAAA
ncbi:AraC family transcriptional regulator [Cupriavidus sp. WGlv3]|uniref:AraC family transcriptional regulator n=1 Tax=Cupriavidus sp. WGlv3 TaxID=2919924 RepID=UPI00209093EB|nr:AraC family transcriptional regulator [Cupriavidus sp. WGlv3]MCO4865145.1 AraC family transcriptional regulator [Cupriavidus sp. WGlv3]